MRRPPYETGKLARLGRWLFVAFCAAVFLFLVAPVLAIVPLSFSSGSLLTYPLPGLSPRWYAEVLTSERWMPALRNSLLLGTATTVLATILGTLGALGLDRMRTRLKPVIMAVILSPMIVPVIITAVGLYFFLSPLGLVNGFAGLLVAHTVLAVPFVVVTVSATLQTFDRNLLRAAFGLGAPPLLAFRKVMLPLIMPGVASGALFAFATSFDEVIAVLLLGGPGQRTLPREMFNGIREHISPAITAIAAMLTVFAVAMLVAGEVLRRRSERLRTRG